MYTDSADAAALVTQVQRSAPSLQFDRRADPVAEIRADRATLGLQVTTQPDGRLAAPVISRSAHILAARSAALLQGDLTDVQRRQLPRTPGTLGTVTAEAVSVAQGGLLAFLIPLMILAGLIAGAQGAALECTVLARERGELELHLLSAVPSSALVLSKMAVVTAFALLGMLATLLGLIVSAALSRLLGTVQIRSSGGSLVTLQTALPLGAADLTIYAAGLLSLSLLIAALLLVLTVDARSLREAQSRLSLLGVSTSVMSVLLQFADVLREVPWTVLLPVVGTLVNILDVIQGRPHGTVGAAVTAALANVALTAALFALAWRLFRPAPLMRT